MRKRTGNFKIKYPINENYFQGIDSSEKAYWLGFLYADGCVSRSTSTVSVALANKDIGHLLKLRKLIQPTIPIKTYELKGRLYSRLSITNKSLKFDLIKLGCLPNKSFKIKFPNWLQHKYVSHFMRGYFDGDGCLTYTYSRNGSRLPKYRWSIVSTLDMCQSVKKLFKEKFGVHSRIDKRWKNRKDTNRNLNVSGRVNIAILLAWLYKDATIYLDRKYVKYREFLEFIEYKKTLRSTCRKLTIEQVVEIRNKYESGGYFYKDLAKEYGLCKDTIAKLITRKQYKEL